jgi:hypothetical protein
MRSTRTYRVRVALTDETASTAAKLGQTARVAFFGSGRRWMASAGWCRLSALHEKAGQAGTCGRVDRELARGCTSSQVGVWSATARIGMR